MSYHQNNYLVFCERKRTKMAFLSNHGISSTILYHLSIELTNQIWIMYYDQVIPTHSHKILLQSV